MILTLFILATLTSEKHTFLSSLKLALESITQICTCQSQRYAQEPTISVVSIFHIFYVKLNYQVVF